MGSVTLRSADPLVPPAIDPRYLSDSEAKAVQQGGNVLAQEPLAGFVESELLPAADVRSDDDLRAHIRQLSQTLYHPAGTCRMGSDPLAVVDPTLRVRGIEGLRVADASVIPELPSGH